LSLALYRKYRPKTFAEIVGQEHIVQTLTNAIAAGKTSHAYLFSGPRGTGKTTIARLLAKSLNCTGKKPGEAEPCNECDSCKQINEGRALDLIEIDAASHTGVDNVRENIIEASKYVPYGEHFKIYLIDETHMLSKGAFNALLKTVEEPPKHVVFILATTEISKVPATILSRVQRFDFRKLKVSELAGRLAFISRQEKVKIEAQALNYLAMLAEGSTRDAESLLDQVMALGEEPITLKSIEEFLGAVDFEAGSRFVDFVAEKNLAGAVGFLNEVSGQGKDMQEFSKMLLNYFRKLMILKIDASLSGIIEADLTAEQLEILKNQAAKFPAETIDRALRLYLGAQNEIKYSPITVMPLEIATVELLKI
jgi:DNA polymerase-3 subunit gamma/tau